MFDAAQLEYGSSASTYRPDVYPNLISNPSVESNTSGFVLRSGTTPVGNSIAVSTDFAQYGNQSLKLVTGTSAAAGNGVQYNYNFAPSSRYSLSFWARRDTGAAITALAVGEQDGAGGADTNCTTNPVIGTVGVTTTWTNFTCSFTTGATIGSSSPSNFYIKQTDTATSRNIYIDGLTLVASPVSQTYNPVGISIDSQPLYGNITLNGGNTGEIQPWATNANALPAGLSSQSSVIANGYVYEIGGLNGTYQTAVYYAKLNSDGSTGPWTTSSNPLPDARGSHSSVVSNGYVYVIGGTSNTTNQSTVFYAKLNADGSTGAWITSSNPLPNVRLSHTSVVANGYVYVIGGSNGSAVSTVYYAKLNADGTTGLWQTSANVLPSVTQLHSSVVANGYVYVIGGNNGSPTSAVFFAKLNADGSTGVWDSNSCSKPAGNTAAAHIGCLQRLRVCCRRY